MESQEIALSLSPKNQEIRLELARLHSWNQNYDLAESMVKEVLTIHPDYSDAQILAKSIARQRNAPIETTSKWQIDIGYEKEGFTRIPQPEWHYYFLQTNYKIQSSIFEQKIWNDAM